MSEEEIAEYLFDPYAYDKDFYEQYGMANPVADALIRQSLGDSTQYYRREGAQQMALTPEEYTRMLSMPTDNVFPTYHPSEYSARQREAAEAVKPVASGPNLSSTGYMLPQSAGAVAGVTGNTVDNALARGIALANMTEDYTAANENRGR
jgi:hypothetical protein